MHTKQVDTDSCQVNDKKGDHESNTDGSSAQCKNRSSKSECKHVKELSQQVSGDNSRKVTIHEI